MLKPLDNHPRHELLDIRQKALDTIAFYEREWKDGSPINPEHLIPYHQSKINAIDRLLARGFDVT